MRDQRRRRRSRLRPHLPLLLQPPCTQRPAPTRPAAPLTCVQRAQVLHVGRGKAAGRGAPLEHARDGRRPRSAPAALHREPLLPWEPPPTAVPASAPARTCDASSRKLRQHRLAMRRGFLRVHAAQPRAAPSMLSRSAAQRGPTRAPPTPPPPPTPHPTHTTLPGSPSATSRSARRHAALRCAMLCHAVLTRAPPPPP